MEIQIILNKRDVSNEKWYDIASLNNAYQVSNHGRIKRKQYIQTYKKSNPEKGRPPYSICHRRYNERIITPKIRCGELSITLEGENYFIKDLINKYVK